MPILAGRCDSLQNTFNGPGQTPTLPADDSQTPIMGSGGAECGALSDDSSQSSQSDPALSELIRAWPTLTGWTRWQIQELVETHNQSNSLTNIDSKSESDSQSH